MNTLARCSIALCWTATFAMAQHTEMLPQHIGAWQRMDTVGRFDPQGLFDLIDGGASLFFEYGFVRACAATYHDAQRAVSVELYTMHDETGAFGVYSSFGSGIGSEVRPGLFITIGQGFAFLCKGITMGSVTLLEGPPVTPDELSSLAAAIAAPLPGRTRLPALIRQLLDAGCDSNGLVLFKGKLGLLNHSSLPGVTHVPEGSGVAGTQRKTAFLAIDCGDPEHAEKSLVTWLDTLTKTGAVVAAQIGPERQLRFPDGRILSASYTRQFLVGFGGPSSQELIHALVPP